LVTKKKSFVLSFCHFLIATYLNAFGLRSKHNWIASFLSLSLASVLKQSLQLQPPQNSPFAKQSQYNFKHCDFVQLQLRLRDAEKKTIEINTKT
jgi:hypothetical protein